MYSVMDMQSMATNIFSAYASVAASMMLFRSVAYDIIPEPVKSAVFSAVSQFFRHYFGRFFNPLPSQITMVVDEQCGITRNQIYDAAEVYLRTVDYPDSERFKVNKIPKQKSISISMEKNQEVVDHFKGFKLKWQFVLIEPENQKNHFQPEKRFFELTFDKARKDDVLKEYLPHVMAKAKEIKDNERAVRLYTTDCPFDGDEEDGGNGGGYWGCINLDHPATFDKLAMDPCLKKSIIEDLERFVRRRDYYKKVGKAWKRGYLLYGPPGTGKSSLIAAMANYLKFDVYDLELASLYSNSELKRILLSTTNRSIIVVEDIDCSVQMHDRSAETEGNESSNPKLTLSGVLNFIDGLWSTCGDERIIIFTTNHKEKLDPALLRPGRMDMHIHMGYCTPEGFDVLALNYLGINDQTKAPCQEIKSFIGEVEISPAEIAEHLMRSEDVDLALQGVLDLLKKKKDEKTSVAVDEKKCDIGEAKEIIESDGIEIHKDQKMKFAKIWKSLTRRRSSKYNKMKHSEQSL
ncbi:AAA-ATPase At2g18193-like [Primulina eburnea]|uniref:AAA-ATPase At2g18193-like n=1 Tax=Primulina eburnea TaxID=1245227 RepID=UPI003C6BFBD1